MRCSSFQKNLSAFIDGELNSRKREQMELHISECTDCHRESERLQEMIGYVKVAPRPEVPSHAWTGTLRKIETADKPPRAWGFGLPKWGTIPVGTAAFALLLYILSTQVFFTTDTGPMSVTVYLQEHELSYSQQVMSPDFLSDLTTTQTDETTGETTDTTSEEPTSELDMLVEVHYGIYPTNGS